MTLTMTHGPLSGQPAPSNYDIEGPAHSLFFDDFPRRVRATLGSATVLDSCRGKLLHETGMLPQLYVPAEDIATELLTRTEHSTYCPFKGSATYWSVSADNRVAENAVWAYEQPMDPAAWLDGYRAVYFDAMDAWYDEDEQVSGHLRDPYHRVDVRHTSARVRVLNDTDIIADTRRALLLSETGLPNRYYLPAEDVSTELLQPSETVTVCPYKGTASYQTLRTDGREVPDAAWSYPEPLTVPQIRDHLCFDPGLLTVDVDRQEQSQ
jgi:uncharacterized protein (DUF427 family)